MKPITPRPRCSFRALAPCALLALLLSGCAGVVPVPAFPNKVQNGHRLTPEQVAFIQPDKTTFEEIEEMLGTDYVTLPRDPAIAYSWEIAGGGGVWWVVVPVPSGGEVQSWVGGWRAFFIAFDHQGVVKANELKRVSPRRSLHEQLREWARQTRDENEELDAGLVAVATEAGIRGAAPVRRPLFYEGQ